MKKVFKRCLTLLLLLLPMGSSLPTRADEVAVFYVTTTTTAGKEYITRLDGIIPYPKVFLDTRKMKVNYRSLSIDEIESIRIEKKMETVDAIKDLTTAPTPQNKEIIYTLGGQRIENRSSLRKGIYIIGGKKILVK